MRWNAVVRSGGVMVAGLAAVLVAGCAGGGDGAAGGGDGDGDGDGDGAAASSDAASSPVVRDAFVGEVAAGGTAALYLTIVQEGGDDRLVGVSTDVSDVVGLMPADMAMDDPLTDRSVDLAIPPGETVRLAPGADHLMVVDVSRDLVPGDNVAVTLVFERHGEVTVEAEISSLLDINERVATERDAKEGSGR